MKTTNNYIHNNSHVTNKNHNNNNNHHHHKPSFWKNSMLTITQIPIKNLSMKTCAMNKSISEIAVLKGIYASVGNNKTKTIGNLYRGISLSFCFSAIDQAREYLVEFIFNNVSRLFFDEKFIENDKYIDYARKFFNITTKASLFIPYNFLLDCYIVSPANYPFIKVLVSVILREQIGVSLNFKATIIMIFKMIFKVLFAPFTLFGIVRHLIFGGIKAASDVKESVVNISTNDQINNFFYAAIPTISLFVGKKLIRNSIHQLELYCKESYKKNPNNQFFKYSSTLLSSFYFRGILTGLLNCPLEVLRLHYVGSFIQSYISTIDYVDHMQTTDRSTLLINSIPIVLNPVSLAFFIIKNEGYSRLFNGMVAYIISNIFIEYYKKDKEYDYFDIFKI